MAINDPRDIPGLVAWYSAEAETGYGDNATIGRWTDQSGNGNHAQSPSFGPRWRSTGGPGGGPTIQFLGVGGQEYALPDLMTGAAAGEVHAYIKSGSTTTGLWSLGSSAGTGDESHYPWGTVVYESFGLASGGRQSFTPTLDIAQWRRYNVWSAPSDWTARLDATVQRSWISSVAVAWDSTPHLGIGEKSGVGDVRFIGYMSMLVLYNRKLTTAERADLDAWMVAHPSGGVPAAPSSVTGTLDLVNPMPVVEFSDTIRGALSLTNPQPSIAVAGSVAAAGALTLTNPKPTLSLAGTVPSVVTGALSLTNPKPTLALAGTVDDTVHTDTANAFNGRRRNGYATVDTEVTVVQRPARHRRGYDYDKAIAYPTPTLVDGRPQ